MECIGNSDALYHNIEHTMLVTLVGHDILVGRAADAADDGRATTRTSFWPVSPMTSAMSAAWSRVTGRRLCCRRQGPQGQAADRIVRRSARALSCRPLETVRHRALRRHRVVDAARIARAIEYTRFPYRRPKRDRRPQRRGRIAAARGRSDRPARRSQLHEQINALFYEFEEIGLNKTLGYATPADIVYKFPQFYWTNVAPQIQPRSAISTSPPAAGNGSPISTATCSGPNAS